MDIDRKQRTDIDTVTNDRLTLAIDEGNIIESPYVQETIESFVGNNWIITDNVYVKYNLVEDDTIIFNYEAITELAQKDITKVTVSFDYLVENIINVLPVLTNVSLNHSMITYKTVDLSLSDEGHVDIDCSLFDIDNEVLNTIISSQGFGIGLSFNGKLSNVTLKLSNVKVKFKFDDKLLPESNSVVNRLEPYIDFYRDGDNLILQVGGDASGKGMDRGGSNTYTKEEIDNKLAAKVNTQVGKMLSSNDYTNDEKTKLSGIEANANYYIHPFTHDSSIIVNSDALTNLDTSANASQSAINAAIDGAIGDKQDKLTSGENIKTINNESVLGSGNITIQGGSNVDIVTQWESTPSDSKVASEKLTKDSLDDKVSKSSTTGLLKNDGTVDTTSYSTFSGSYNDLSNKPTIPTKISDLTNDSDFIEKSNISGLVKNDGSIDTNTYLSSSVLEDYVQKNIILYNGANLNDINVTGFYYCPYNVVGTTISNTPNNVQSAFYLLVEDMGANISTKKKQTFTTTSDGKTWIRTKSSGSWQSWKQLSTFSGSYDDLSNKPSIPSKISDLTNDSNFIETSSTSGLVKNDGTIDTTTYSTFSGSYNDLSNKPTIPSKISDLTNDSDFIEKSNTSGLVKNDGSIDTTSYLSSLPSHTHDDRYYTETEVDTALSGKQATLVSGTNVKTINNESILGSGNISVGGSDIVTSWENTLSDTKVPSEKLAKNTIDLKVNIAQGSTNKNKNVVTDNSGNITMEAKPTIPSKVSDLTNDSGFITSSSLPTKVSDLQNDTGFITSSSLPTKTSDLTNDGDGTNAFLTQHQSLSNYIQKSNTSGLIKNDGSIDTNTYLTQHQSLTDYVQKDNGANTMTDSSAYSTIGTSANATQKTINAAIDSKLDDIYDTFLCENLLFDESDLLGGS